MQHGDELKRQRGALVSFPLPLCRAGRQSTSVRILILAILVLIRFVRILRAALLEDGILGPGFGAAEEASAPANVVWRRPPRD